jgi:hypothetical protein
MTFSISSAANERKRLDLEYVQRCPRQLAGLSRTKAASSTITARGVDQYQLVRPGECRALIS